MMHQNCFPGCHFLGVLRRVAADRRNSLGFARKAPASQLQWDTMADLAVGLWSMLPLEIVERVLSFLPVPVLFRFRTVCKRWNSLICNSDFVEDRMRATQDNGGFIVLRGTKGCSFLDLSAWRWYTVKDTERELFGPSIRLGNVVAMDAGIVCQHWYAKTFNFATVYVLDTIAKTYTKLPSCAAIAGVIRPVVNMVVDSIAHSYKIFLIPDDASADKPFMVIYESTTNSWRNSSLLPREFPFGAGCSVFHDGLLYVLMSPFSATTLNAERNCLWSYNPVEDVWKNTLVNIPDIRSVRHYPQLIVSGNRLFLAAWMQKLDPDVEDQSDLSFKTWPGARYGWSYEICEVHLEDRTCCTVFEMTEADMRIILEVPRISRRRFSPDHLKAFGCCKSIVLLCMSNGMSIVFDRSTSSWEMFPYKPPEEAHGSCLGKPMNLILPVHTRWISSMD